MGPGFLPNPWQRQPRARTGNALKVLHVPCELFLVTQIEGGRQGWEGSWSAVGSAWWVSSTWLEENGCKSKSLIKGAALG